MKEITVHVKNLEQWRSVLDIWFDKGYGWIDGDTGYFEYGLKMGNTLTLASNGKIIFGRGNDSIEYSEFMAQQKEEHMETHYVTKEQLKLIKVLKNVNLPFFNLVNSKTKDMKSLSRSIPDDLDKPLLRYIGGDDTIEFRVKEQLYRLWLIDKYGDKVYFFKRHSFWDAPLTMVLEDAFTAPLEEIKKWQTPDWSVEEVE